MLLLLLLNKVRISTDQMQLHQTLVIFVHPFLLEFSTQITLIKLITLSGLEVGDSVSYFVYWGSLCLGGLGIMSWFQNVDVQLVERF